MSPPPPCPKYATNLRRPEVEPPHGDGDGDGADRPWDSLPEGVLELIGWRVLSGDLLDYIRFRAVCTHWHRSTDPPAGRGLLDPRFHPRHWIVLPEGRGVHSGHPALGGHARFLNLSTGAVVRVHLPLLHDHVVLDSADGLLLLRRRQDTAVRLLHPFTGDTAELPSLCSLLLEMERYRTKTEICELRGLSSSVRAAVTVHTAARAITVMLAIRSRVAHATTGHQRWTVSSGRLPGKRHAFRGKIYSSYRAGDSVCILQIDPPQPDAAEGSPLPRPTVIARYPLLGNYGKVDLVECGSELMVVGFNAAHHELQEDMLSDGCYGSDDHEVVQPANVDVVVYRLADLVAGRVAPITDIGEHAIFLKDRTLCVSQNERLPSVVGNSITWSYRVRWTNHNPRRLLEQYHIGTATWSPAIDGDDYASCLTATSPPFTLIHHILTCCQHSYWSKGLMYPDELDW